MIIIAAGMQKSGSAWYFNLINEILISVNLQDVHLVREKFHLDNILRWDNCNMGIVTFRKLIALAKPHFLGNTFVVKTHESPSLSLRYFMLFGIARAAYIYRDPRDVVISAFEHGQDIRKRGKTHTFAVLGNIEESIMFTKNLLPVWEKWMKCPYVFHTRYEDLLSDPVKILINLADFLSINISSQQLQGIVGKYAPRQMGKYEEGILHFNKGETERFKKVLTRKQLDLCNKYFGNYLEKMGYSII